jgi:uncharacterized membrane protein
MESAQTVLVHFYRAVVSHADVWRQRMDATTNWAAATSAGMVTFALGDPNAPHIVLLLALGFDVIFLLMESRRYQAYDLWYRRLRVLNQSFIAPALSPGDADQAAADESLARLAVDLGRAVPHLSLLHAMGFRLRRNYGYLIGAVIISWIVKLTIHPQAAASVTAAVERARIGSIGGAVIAAAVGLLVVLAAVLAVRAPSEKALNWPSVTSP